MRSWMQWAKKEKKKLLQNTVNKHMNKLNPLIYLARFQHRVKSKLAPFFPVLLNFSLPTISSNPPLEFDPAEMMKEALHTSH